MVKAYICYTDFNGNQIRFNPHSGRTDADEVEVELTERVKLLTDEDGDSRIEDVSTGAIYFDCDLFTQQRNGCALVLAREYKTGDALGRATGRVFTVAKYKGIV